MTIRPTLAGLTVDVEVLQARGLIAKDRSLLGKRTSDPYIEVHYGQELIGKTRTIKKNVSPVWNEKFQLSVGADAALLMIHPGSQAHLELRIFDEDKGPNDDPMGTVLVPLKPQDTATSQTWYPVGKGTGKFFCHNAQGEVEVKVTMTGRQMVDLERGNLHQLQYNRITVGLAWDIEQGQMVDLDSSCVAVNREGNVDMNESVYYGNLVNSNLSLVHSGDEQTGEAGGDDERIQVELDRIPSHIIALYFILTLATPPNKTFADVKSAKMRFLSTETKAGICRFVPSEMGNNTALFLVRIAREGTHWNLTPIAEGDECARDFGSLIPELKGYSRDLVPGIVIDPQERIAIMRKGGTIRVTDYLPGHKLPPWVTFGLAWDVTNGVNIDLDASAIMLNESLELVDIVSFQQLTSKDGSIRHSGDEREGDEVGDDEKINVALASVDPQVKYIGFVINSFSGQELDDIAKAACHLFDPQTHTEIAKYTLTNSHELDKHTALVMGCLYRAAGDEWHLRIISQPAQGLVAQKVVDELQTFLLCYPPQALSFPPDPEIVLTEMPDTVPIEEEIVVVPESDLNQYNSYY